MYNFRLLTSNASAEISIPFTRFLSKWLGTVNAPGMHATVSNKPQKGLIGSTDVIVARLNFKNLQQFPKVFHFVIFIGIIGTALPHLSVQEICYTILGVIGCREVV